ncbi:MAG TPA: hypothetical protein VEJ18_06255, partial [Planctomycetota bacterium]|nr:hypothetical protein [Planctomycetota bacterium]
GYEKPADGFGLRGAGFDTVPGGEGILKVRRINIAERLSRITGQGLYHHAVRAGRPVPIKNPVLNAGVTGQDTAVAVAHDGKLRWFWGDTSLWQQPLGHFGTSTATAPLDTDPAVGIDLTYAVNSAGRCRATFDLGRPGPVWVHGGFVLDGRILTQYERVTPEMKRLEVGIAEFDAKTETFTPVVQLDLKEERHPYGQPFRAVLDGVDYLYFALPYPFLRVRATRDDVLDPAKYEAFTCLRGTYDAARPDVVRSDGQAVYAWRPGAVPVLPDRQEEMIKAGHLKPEEAWIRTLDAATGRPIKLHRGSVRWNEHRKRWVMIASRIMGEESVLGDVHYAEAERPEGPWPKSVKVVGHRKYTFYNPVHHAFFDREGGRIIHFEGTYTTAFSGNDAATPRYEYNQILYRLDLDDPRLAPAR